MTVVPADGAATPAVMDASGASEGAGPELVPSIPELLLRFTKQAYGASAVHEDWDEFTGFEALEFDPNTPLMQLFMPWFFNCWAPDPVTTEVVNKSLHGVIPIKAYLATKGPQLDQRTRWQLPEAFLGPGP